MTKRTIRIVCVLAVLGLVLAACGSSSKTTKKTVTTTSVNPNNTTTTTSPPSPHKASATPTTGLTNGATVTVTVSAFTPGKTLGINECAQVGDASVGQNDCDLGGIKTLTVGPDGKGTGATPVKSSGIGAANHNCLDPTTRCFISVGELSADPNAERADDVNIKFTS